MHTNRYIGLALAVTGTLAIGKGVFPIKLATMTDGICDYRNEFCYHEKGELRNPYSKSLSAHWIPRRVHGRLLTAHRGLWMQRKDMASRETDSHILKLHSGGQASYLVCT